MLEETQVRLEKLEKLKALGMDPYAVTTQRDTSAEELLASFDAWSEEKRVCTIAGRILSVRIHGGMMFADVMDGTGKFQIAFKEDKIGEEAFGQFRDLVDPGDIVEIRGTLFTTKRGEKSLQTSAWTMLTKALLPLPEKWHGLQDVEKRYRHRELDLIANQEVKERFVVRSKLVASLRRFLADKDFLEVETPILQPIPGGANARPFVTQHNALDIDLYLRIAPELYLKRLLVGGFEKVFEIARCFRNEGIDYAHNPEFTQIELYWAYADKEAFFGLMEDMIMSMCIDALGTTKIVGEESELAFVAPFKRMTFREAVLGASGIDINQCESVDDLKAAVKKAKVKVDFANAVGLGEHLDELYKKTARAKLKGPVWILDYPIEMKPLAGRSPKDPTKSATAQLVVEGAEIVNAYYHELHDPIDQRKRFEEQQKLEEEGSEEAQRMDEEFLEAIEHGMPPACGLGMGIDRLTAVLTAAHSLKEVILFPTLRPLPRQETEEE